MAHPVSKLIPQAPASTTRKSRVARVSAKAARRGKRGGGGGVEGAAPPKAKRPRPDNATYLSMYFRDMATLDVLRPEEEFTSAREIESLEIMLWEVVLSFPPAIEHVIEAVATVPDWRPIVETKALAKLAEGRDA